MKHQLTPQAAALMVFLSELAQVASPSHRVLIEGLMSGLSDLNNAAVRGGQYEALAHASVAQAPAPPMPALYDVPHTKVAFFLHDHYSTQGRPIERVEPAVKKSTAQAKRMGFVNGKFTGAARGDAGSHGATTPERGVGS